jgi:ketosteroid isomerase-like protein
VKWLLLVLAACASPQHQIDDALAQYRAAVLAMDVDASVAMTAPSVVVSHADEPPVIGREAFRALLRSFHDFRVTAYDLVPSSTTVDGKQAIQRGTYHQAVVTPDGTHLDVHGVFEATWKLEPDEHWRIARMHTAPH